jgi:hypothetical protein
MIHRNVLTGQLCVTAVLLVCFSVVWPVTPEASSSETSVEYASSSQRVADDGEYHFKIQHAQTSETDFLDYESSSDSGPITAFSGGNNLYESFFRLPLDVPGYLSMQSWDKNKAQPDTHGVSVYAKDLYESRLPDEAPELRVGLGEELSHTSRTPTAEERDFARKDAESERLLNDYDSLDVPLSRFSGRESGHTVDDIFIGYTIWHRSSIYDLLSEPGAGTDYQGITVEFIY